MRETFLLREVVGLHPGLRLIVQTCAMTCATFSLSSDAGFDRIAAENIAIMRILVVEDEPDLQRGEHGLRHRDSGCDAAAYGWLGSVFTVSLPVT